MMQIAKLFVIVLLALNLSGCVLLAAGAAGVGLENHREWCREHYGNVRCSRAEQQLYEYKRLCQHHPGRCR
jgi:hypothetical protein